MNIACKQSTDTRRIFYCLVGGQHTRPKRKSRGTRGHAEDEKRVHDELGRSADKGDGTCYGPCSHKSAF